MEGQLETSLLSPWLIDGGINSFRQEKKKHYLIKAT